jgi:hypothetical protein
MDLTIGAWIFLIVVWVLILGAVGISMKMILSNDKKKK